MIAKHLMGKKVPLEKHPQRTDEFPENKKKVGVLKQTMNMKSASLEPVFNPRTIALIGASANELKSGGMFLQSFIDCGLKCKLFLVNPKCKEIRGLMVYPNVLEIPEEIDLAITAIPASVTPKVVEDCAKKGVKFILIHASGFGEAGLEGKKMEEKMTQTARNAGSNIIGPNTLGIYCPESGLNTIAPHDARLTKESGDIALVSQSGWVCEYVACIGFERGLRFTKVVDIGNQSDLTFVEFLEYLGSDQKTSIISVYLESVKRGRDLIEKAEKISRSKPIIFCEGGRTKGGIKAERAHTGFWEGEYQIQETEFKQAGIITTQGIDEFLDLLIAFRSPYLPKGNKVGIICEAGGAGVIAADFCETFGLNVITLPEETQLRLKDFLRGLTITQAAIHNPIDTGWHPTGPATILHSGVIEAMSEVVDAFLVLPYGPYDEDYLSALTKTMEEVKKPVFCIPIEPTDKIEVDSWIKRKLPAYPTSQRAARALSALAQRNDFLNKNKE